jgi:hypothetical protein
LLALFALATTPKLAIHALVAHHQDTHLRLDYGTADQLNKAGFHCATDNLVVEFPFLNYALPFQLGPRPSFVLYRPVSLEAPLSTRHPLYGLRGPPVSFLL